MPEMLDVYVVEDDAVARNGLIAAMKKYPQDIKLCGYTDSSLQAYDTITALRPHAVIVDLELKRGAGDGLQLIKDLHARKEKAPYILVTTNNVSRTAHETSRHYGCDYIMTKCEGDYTPAKAITHLVNSKPVILGTEEKAAAPLTQAPETDEKDLRKRIHYELNALGVNPKCVGYPYLEEAILLIMRGAERRVTESVAKIFKKSGQSVERAMQNAINRTWTVTDAAVLSKNYTAYVPPDRGVPTLTQFIYFYARKINDN